MNNPALRHVKTMVLAAGVGSRLDPLTSLLPKPLVPIANRPVMEHMLGHLKKFGIKDICANLHYLPEKLQQYFAGGDKFDCNLTFHHEEKLTGDAGGVRALKNFLDSGTFLVVMGDLFTDADLAHIVGQHWAKKALATIAVKPVPMSQVNQFGVVLRDSDGFITGFQEKPEPSQALSNMISTGIYVFEPEVFDLIPKDGPYGFGRELFPRLVKEGLPLLGVEFNTYWSDVGTIQQYRESNLDALAERISIDLPGRRISIGKGTAWLEEGAVIEDGCDIDGMVMLGKRSRVEAGARLSGAVVVGDDCTIESDASVANSVLWSGVTVQSSASVDQSVLGFNCVAKRNSRYYEATEVVSQPNSLSLVI